MEETATPAPAALDTPALRDDDVGRLVGAVIGSETAPPDPTAVPLLIDALKGEGREAEANDLHKWTVNVCLQYHPSHVGGLSFDDNWARMFENDWGHLRYDLYSVVGVLAARVHAARQPAREEASVLTLNTVRVHCPGSVPRVGRRMRTSDGRSGVVVSVEPDNWVNLVFDDTGEAYAEEDYIGEPAVNASPVRRMR